MAIQRLLSVPCPNRLLKCNCPDGSGALPQHAAHGRQFIVQYRLCCRGFPPVATDRLPINTITRCLSHFSQENIRALLIRAVKRTPFHESPVIYGESLDELLEAAP